MIKSKYWVLGLLFMGCSEEDLTPPAPEVMVVETFSIKENTVSDGSNLVFTLGKEGSYTLTLLNGTQVVSREKIVGKTGINTLKIYTKSFQTKNLTLELQDSENKKIGSTSIIIK